MLTLIKHIRVSCRGYDVPSRFTGEVILKSLKYIFRTKTKSEDSEDDEDENEDEVYKESEERESLWGAIVKGLSSLLPLSSESDKEDTTSIP